jgi:hypothetical protein
MTLAETPLFSKLPRLRWAIGIALVLVCSIAIADQKDDLATLELEAAQAENGTAFQSAVRKFLDVPGNVDRINTLRKHADDTLSLCGAWELVRDSVPVERQGRPNNLRRPNAIAIERFLGFAEGRLRIEIPAWWERNVRDCVSDGAASWPMSGPRAATQYHAAPSPPGLFPDAKDRQLVITWYYGVIPVKDSFMLSSGIYRKHDGDAKTSQPPPDELPRITCKLPAQIVEKLREGPLNALTCYMDDHFCLVAVTPLLMDASPYEVYCIDHREERTVWQATVWTGGGDKGPLGPRGGEHAASIELKQGRVLIFGVESRGAYFEGFSLKDGKPLVRFSTSY